MTTIKFGLSEGSIDKALNQLQAYKKRINLKTIQLRQELALEIGVMADRLFKASAYNNAEPPEVDVTVSDKGNVSVVVAYGEEAIFCEFGAGVYYNGSVGSSPHPMGVELGYTIGGYGKGKGSQKAWGYYKDGVKDKAHLVITHGTPATMPMYNSAKIVAEKSIEIARRVFND